MSKFTEELQGTIVSLIEKDAFSITEIYVCLKISGKSFYECKSARSGSGFREAIEKAAEHRDGKLRMLPL